MNKNRRKQLADIANRITDLKELVEGIMDKEEEYKDNIPENLQGSSRYETAQNACDKLSEAVSNLEEAFDCIEDAKGA